MPADTRSARKAKHDDVGSSKEKRHCEEESENATGSKCSIRETSSKKCDSSSLPSTRKSVRLKSGNYQASSPSPLRKSERAKVTPNSDKSEKSSSLTDAVHKSHKRKNSVNQMVIEANQVNQHGKLESNASSQRKKTLPANRYRDLFRAHTMKVKASDSVNTRRRVGPCTSSTSGSSSKTIPVAEEGGLKEEGKCGENYAECTSQSDQGGLDFALREVASETAQGQNNMAPHPGQRQWSGSAEVSMTCSKRQRLDGHVPERLCSDNTNLLQDTRQNLMQEVCSEGETCAHMDVCRNGDVNIEEKDLQLDAQMDCVENKCIICKFTGRLLYCGGKGCGRRCHPACLNSRWEDVYPGGWHCPWCTMNKIEFGIHSVSEGIESIWDIRVENIQNCEGFKGQKEYFAKYKGLSHVHNRWLPEQQLLLEAPELVAEFVQRGNAIPWRQEWCEPHRLLQKRSLVLPKSDGCVAQEVHTVNCQCEWLVKWRGLDYNEITWELETAVFFQTPKALDLLNEYERRQERARRTPLLQDLDEIKEKKKDFSVNLSTLPSGSDTNCMNIITNLCDYWSKGQNALLIKEQVQVAHIICFMLTVKSNVSRPFLVIAPSSSISKWEVEFSLVAPSINTIVYNGNRDARKMIRTLEFYEDGSRVMFEVLLSTLDIITEDLEFIKCLRWEAVIMEECRKSETSAEYIFVKELASGSMILLLIDQIKDNAIDYRNTLSLLERGSCDVEGHQDDSNSIALLREKLSPFIVYGPTPRSSTLVEYWVPVQISNVQLEQYCSSLLTNLDALCLKNDPVGLLREILISTRKCCDHPYIIEEKLQSRLIEGCTPAESLDLGVEASGKFHFLDTILTKMKDQGQKIVILFKTLGGSGRDSLGDILNDYVHKRFGEDSYERVDGGGVPSKRQASVNKFNDEGRFIFLLETRACSPSIKLSSVDAVIIFGSDWNPLKDLKALQKIKIDSKLVINVFRLYNLCTIEERLLLLSKKRILLESTLQGIGVGTSHMLLTWGASYLFKKLDEFHDCPGSPEILPRNSILKDVVQEFMSLLQKHGAHISTKFITSARQNDRCYSTDISLLGEHYSHLKDEDQHHLFWTKLLEGRQPRWRYLSLSSQRNRKRVQYYGGTPEENVQIDETLKRQKKTGNTNVEPCSPRVNNDVGKESVSGSFGTSPENGPESSPKSACGTASARKIHSAISSDKLRDEHEILQQVLKPDMENLFQILRLKEDVQQMAERFLAYMITNHRVIREPDQLQAFQISVCWIAASILSEKLDHVESLSIAREHLNFNCKTDEAEFAFLKMQFSMKMFLRSEGVKLQASSKNLVSGTEGFACKTRIDNVRESTMSVQQKEKVAEGMLLQEGFDKQAGEKKSKYYKKIEKRIRKLLDRQSNEKEELKKQWQDRKAYLEKSFKLESVVIRSISSSEAFRTDKLKILEADHRQKLDELDSEMDTRFKDLKERHEVERKEEEKEEIRKIYECNFRTKSGLFDNLQSKESFEEFMMQVVPAKSSSFSGNDLEEENANMHRSAFVQVPPSRTPETVIGNNEVAAVPVDKERVISDTDATISKPPAAIQTNNEATTFANAGDRTADSSDVQGWHVSQADEHEQIATSKNDQLSAENPTSQTEADTNEEVTAASERYTAARMEQHDEASSSTHIKFMNSPSTVNPSVVQPVTNNQCQVDSMSASQDHATSCARLNQLNKEDVCAEPSGIDNGIIQGRMRSSDHSDGMPLNTSDQAVYNGLPHEPAVSLDTAVSLPIGLTQAFSASCGVPQNQLNESSLPCRTPEVPLQQDQSPLNRSAEAFPYPSLHTSFNPPLHYSSQFESYMGSRSLPSSLSASCEFDPLQREYERICGESNKVSKSHEDMVVRKKLERDKEIEEIVGQIRTRYEVMFQEAEADFLQKKKELEHNQWKVLMNIKLTEAFRCKCIDTRTAFGVGPQQAVGSSLTQQLLDPHQFRRRLVSAAPQNVNHSMMPQRSNSQMAISEGCLAGFNPTGMLSQPNCTTLRPQPQLQPQTQMYVARPMSLTQRTCTDQSAARLATAPLPPLPDIARNFDAWNLTEFEATLDARQQQQVQGPNAVVCLSDDE